MRTKLIALAGLAIVAVACNKENVPQVNENGRVTVSFNASPADTKVVYTEDAAGEYYNIDWSENDEVGLYAIDAAELTSHSDLFKFTRVHDNVFTGEVTPWEGGMNISGVWPYDADRTPVKIPEQHWGAGELGYYIDQQTTPVTVPAGDNEYNHTLLMAYGTDRTYNKIGNLHFHQMYAIVKMNVTGVPAGAKVASVEMRASGSVFYGKTVGVNAHFNLNVNETSDVGYNGQVKMNVSGTEDGQNCIINLPILPTTGLKFAGVTDGDAFIFTVKLSNGDSFEKTLANKVMLESGHVYKLNMPLQDLAVNDLSEKGTANCYIVSSAGSYKFKTVKGNSTTSVGTVSSVSVLWESFGTSTTPSVGDLVNTVSYSNGYITFKATSKKGNAVIAAKNSSGAIIWSWHIWLTNNPIDQVYNNGAGSVMDRNLGATSATPGAVSALGLLFQWGRKDPFLCADGLTSSTKAASTITWPADVTSTSSTGTAAYTISHPTTFINLNTHNSDWYYSSSNTTDNTRWKSSKGLYDPCPAGYRVPDGGMNGLWQKAFGTSATDLGNNPFGVYYWNSSKKGMNFGATSPTLGSSATIWYPTYSQYGDTSNYDGSYWSCTAYGTNAYQLNLHYNSVVKKDNVIPSDYTSRVKSRFVRCVAE